MLHLGINSWKIWKATENKGNVSFCLAISQNEYLWFLTPFCLITSHIFLNNQEAKLSTRSESLTGRCVKNIETLSVMLKFTRKLIFYVKSQGCECAQLMLPIIFPIESVWVWFVETVFNPSNLKMFKCVSRLIKMDGYWVIGICAFTFDVGSVSSHVVLNFFYLSPPHIGCRRKCILSGKWHWWWYRWYFPGSWRFAWLCCFWRR